MINCSGKLPHQDAAYHLVYVVQLSEAPCPACTGHRASSQAEGRGTHKLRQDGEALHVRENYIHAQKAASGATPATTPWAGRSDRQQSAHCDSTAKASPTCASAIVHERLGNRPSIGEISRSRPLQGSESPVGSVQIEQ